MSDITIKSDDVKKLKNLIIARKIALEYDYCLSEEDLKDEEDHLINEIFGSKNVTLTELQESCREHGGNRSDEIENSLVSTLSKLLK